MTVEFEFREVSNWNVGEVSLEVLGYTENEWFSLKDFQRHRVVEDYLMEENPDTYYEIDRIYH